MSLIKSLVKTRMSLVKRIVKTRMILVKSLVKTRTSLVKSLVNREQLSQLREQQRQTAVNSGN